MLLYNHLKHKGTKAKAMLRKYPISSLTRLHTKPACRMVGQILHVKKASRITVYTKSDKSKKTAKTYDRLLFLRDLVSGHPFVVISETKQDSVVLFHAEAKIGDYVTLYLPEHSKHSVAELDVVRYRDVLFPLKNVPCNKLVSKVPQGVKFATFATEVDRKDFEMIAVGVETVCSGQMCDGAIGSECPCLGGSTMTKQAVSFKMNVPVKGIEETHVRYRSIGFTRYFFGPTVMKNLYLYEIHQVEEVLAEGMKHVDRILIAGWVGYTLDTEDDIGMAATTHVTSVGLTFLEDEDGEPTFKPNDDLKLPPENIDEQEDESETDDDESIDTEDSDDDQNNEDN